MITEKDTIKCETIFNDNKTHRYLCKRVWDKDKPCLGIIMLNPNLSNNLVNDLTTSLVINNVARLGEYGGVHILNLYSILTNKLDFVHNTDEVLNDKANDDYIEKSAQECSKVILAWGRTENNNQRIAARADEVRKLLLPYEDKLYYLTDGEKVNIHPLCTSVRTGWQLEKADVSSELLASK